MFEVADATMNKPGRPAGGTTRKVVLLHEGHAKAPHGGIPRRTGTGYPSAYDQDVKNVICEIVKDRGPGSPKILAVLWWHPRKIPYGD